MTKAYKIIGTTSLNGTINIQGSKNASLPIIIAALLCKSKTTLFNVPDITDVHELLKILNKLNVATLYKNNTLKIDSRHIQYKPLKMKEIKNFRASYYFIGLFLSLFNKVEILLPGGCKIGKRPIDQHIKGLKLLGAKIALKDDVFIANIEEIIPTTIVLDIVSFGATVNIILASLFTKKIIIINNAATEPEIIDLIAFLNKCGFNILVKNTNTITINPSKKIINAKHTIIPDRIVAGTFAVFGALLSKKLIIHNFIFEHNELLLKYLSKINVSMKINKRKKTLIIYQSTLKNSLNVSTGAYPSFPTDLQPIITVLLFFCDSNSLITENMFENRFLYLHETTKMGSVFKIQNNIVEIFPSKINNAEIECKDLRGGAALLLLCLKANGTSILKNIDYIERGYENLFITLNKLGANIREINIKE